MRFLPVFLIFALIGFSSTAQAENVFLKDGRVISGRISNQTRTDITLETAQGTVKLQKDQIRRIQYDTGADDKAKEEARKAEEKRRQEELKKQQDEYKRQQDEIKKQQDAKNADEKKRADQKAEEAKKLTDKQKDEERKKRQQEDAARTTKQGPSLAGALMRSMVVPGWGQYYQGRTKVGLGYAGLWTLTGIGTLYEQERYRKNREVYGDATNFFLIGTPLIMRNAFSFSQSDAQAAYWFLSGYGRNQAARQRMELHANRLEVLKTSLVAFYAWNLVDVVLFRPSQKTAIRMGTDGEKMQIAVTSQF